MRALGEVGKTQSVYQWVQWLTRPAPEDEVPNIYWIISLFPVTKKDNGNPNPGNNLWVKPVVALKDLLNNKCDLKRELVFCTYHFIDVLKEFSVGGVKKGWSIIKG